MYEKGYTCLESYMIFAHLPHGKKIIEEKMRMKTNPHGFGNTLIISFFKNSVHLPRSTCGCTCLSLEGI